MWPVSAAIQPMSIFYRIRSLVTCFRLPNAKLNKHATHSFPVINMIRIPLKKKKEEKYEKSVFFFYPINDIHISIDIRWLMEIFAYFFFTWKMLFVGLIFWFYLSKKTWIWDVCAMIWRIKFFFAALTTKNNFKNIHISLNFNQNKCNKTTTTTKRNISIQFNAIAHATANYDFYPYFLVWCSKSTKKQ